MSLETLILEPGQTQPVNRDGDFFAIVLAPVDVMIRLPGNPEYAGDMVFSQGDSLALSPGAFFNRLEVRNPTAQNVVVQLYVGRGRYSQQRQAIIEPKKRIKAQSGSLAGGATLDLTSVLEAGDIRRKHVVVSNVDATLTLECVDMAGVRFQVIQPKDSHVVDLSEPFMLKNPNGAAVQYALGEVVWTV